MTQSIETELRKGNNLSQSKNTYYQMIHAVYLMLN